MRFWPAYLAVALLAAGGFFYMRGDAVLDHGSEIAMGHFMGTQYAEFRESTCSVEYLRIEDLTWEDTGLPIRSYLSRRTLDELSDSANLWERIAVVSPLEPIFWLKEKHPEDWRSRGHELEMSDELLLEVSWTQVTSIYANIYSDTLLQMHRDQFPHWKQHLNYVALHHLSKCLFEKLPRPAKTGIEEHIQSVRDHCFYHTNEALINFVSDSFWDHSLRKNGILPEVKQAIVEQFHAAGEGNCDRVAAGVSL